jgi:hypothetical protein
VIVSSVEDGGRVALRLSVVMKNTKEGVNMSRTENRKPYPISRFAHFGMLAHWRYSAGSTGSAGLLTSSAAFVPTRSLSGKSGVVL